MRLIASDHNRPFLTVAVDDLEDYPNELIEVAPATDYFVRFYHQRWLNSTLHLRASMAVQGMAMNLFFIARQQNPMGSLPNDPDMLARLLRITSGEWATAMKEPITPLHGWRQYRCGEGVVLGHEVVMSECLDALSRREARNVSKDQKATAMRLKRLCETLRGMGRDYASLSAKADVVAKLDKWLVDHHVGQRRAGQIEPLIERACQEGWKSGWLE